MSDRIRMLVRRSIVTAAAVLSLAPRAWGRPGPAETGRDQATGQGPRLTIQTGHQSSVLSAAFSPDGRSILTGGEDQTARLWDAESGRIVRIFKGHTGAVTAVAISPDRSQLLTGSRDGTARLWDARTGESLHMLGDLGRVTAVAFSPDGRQILTGGDEAAQLWDASTRARLASVGTGAAGPVRSIAFAPGGPRVLTYDDSGERVPRLWEVATGRCLRTLPKQVEWEDSILLSPDGRTILTVGNVALRWDVETGRHETFPLNQRQENGVAVVASFSRDGRRVLKARGGTVEIFDAGTFRPLRSFKAEGWIRVVASSPDDRYIFAAGEDPIGRLWDAESGAIRYLGGRIRQVDSVAFSPDGRFIFTGGNDRGAQLWDIRSGRPIHSFNKLGPRVASVAFSPDGRLLLTGCSDATAQVWDAQTGRLLRGLQEDRTPVEQAMIDLASLPIDGSGGPRPVGPAAVLPNAAAVAFSPDGTRAVTGFDLDQPRSWDVATGKMIHAFQGAGSARSVAFSPDGRRLLAGGVAIGGRFDKQAGLWDAGSGEFLRNLEGDSNVTSVTFSPDGRRILTGSEDGMVRFWDAETGKLLHPFRHGSHVTSAAFSPDGRRILAGGYDGEARLWDVGDAPPTDDPSRILEGHDGIVTSVAFTKDGRFIATACTDGFTRIWEARHGHGRELCRLASFDDNSWAVVDDTGRYDAPNGGDVAELHWVVGDEPIELGQLKARYYDPGLLAKHLGLLSEPLRDVQGLAGIALFPEVVVTAPDPDDPRGTLDITLTDRGGGIGRLAVKVNGKEIAADARGLAPDTDPRPDVARLSLPIAADPRLVPGAKNTVEVLAYDARDNLRSRGSSIELLVDGLASAPDPELWAVVVGTSDYNGPRIDLRYAARDAESFATALRVVAARLLGEGRVHITTLSTRREAPEGRPTKVNIVRALEAARAARPNDLLVVYLAGHGVAPPGQDEYYYLTADAQSLKLVDPEVRRRDALSGAELADRIREVPANKQVLVLDTCAAGRAFDRLGERREVTGDQVRALERLKDRMGMHVLAGAAADAPSYEASRFAQGLLTYSLLLGMTGPGLKEGGEVDVLTWFGYAVDQVPALAQGIGGIQRPLLTSPRGGANFPIGRVTDSDRTQIPLMQARPLVLRAHFQEEESFDDVLGLGGRVDEAFRTATARGGEAGPVFVDAGEAAGAYRLAGRYRIAGEAVAAAVRVFRGRDLVGQVMIDGKRADVEALAQQIVAEVVGLLRP